jgi:hypothetical protein
MIASDKLKPVKGGELKENIMSTTDCFKSLCMLALSESGKKFQRYYLDLEKIFKRYIILEFQQKDEKLLLKDEEIQQERTKKDQANQIALKFQTLYNTNTQKHHFWKFLIKGACFYIIISGIDAADGIMRIKIGVAGCKSKGTKCTNCDFQKDSKKTESIDKRLGDHRTLWPQLKVKYLVYTTDAELLEKCLKRVYNFYSKHNCV